MFFQFSTVMLWFAWVRAWLSPLSLATILKSPPKQVVVMNIELDDSEGRDRLSDLPLSIIHIILALIPIREAVRTSVLSKEWRYTWTTLPQLHFDYRCVSREKKEANRCEDFITQVLFHHKGPIHKCRIYCPCNFRNLDEWVLRLSGNDIQELILVLPPYELSWATDPSIYSCKKLTYLRLDGFKLDPPPLTFKGFLFLRVLSLSRVGLSADAIYSLAAACPLLETFELNDRELELKISAPNLKHMRLVGGHGKISINAPLMTEMSVLLTYYNAEGSDQQLKSSACDYAKCFGGFTNLQKLSGSHLFTEYLGLGIELSHPSLVFHHLKLIDLDVDFEDVKQILVVAHLVIGAPNLQELKIADYSFRKDDESDSEAPLLSFKDLGCFKLEKLTDVSVLNVNCLVNVVEFLKFLLESSPSLENMSLALLSDSEEKRNNMRAKLEGCNWASPTAKLEVDDLDFTYQ